MAEAVTLDEVDACIDAAEDRGALFVGHQPRYIADEREAEEAFAREVTASLQDPVIVALMERGTI